MYSKDELFIQTAKKKPRLQAYLDNLDSMSEEDIESLNEAIWIRDALKILKKTNGVGHKDRKIKFMDDLIAAEKERADRAAVETYQVRTWGGDLTFIKGTTIDRRRSWEIEVKHGEPLLFKDKDVVVIAGEFFILSTQEMYRVNDNSKLLGEFTLQGYFNYYKETYLNGL
jgi:LPS O-antigen subunit length determinant protein (WzzB/FepE family)